MNRRLFLSLIALSGCASRQDAPAQPRTPEEIFDSVYKVFKYKPDDNDYWMSPLEIREQIVRLGYFEADCEDFATWCIHLGRRAGLNCSYVICLDTKLRSHCVAKIDNLIFCCQQTKPRKFSDLGYVFVKEFSERKVIT